MNTLYVYYWTPAHDEIRCNNNMFLYATEREYGIAVTNFVSMSAEIRSYFHYFGIIACGTKINLNSSHLGRSRKTVLHWVKAGIRERC